MYCKKILILQQTDVRFAEYNKELCGMVKFVNNSSNATIVTVFVTNANPRPMGEWWILLSFGKDMVARQLETFNNHTFSLPTKNLQNVGCILVKRESKCYEVARASNASNQLCDVLHANMQKLIKAQDAENCTSSIAENDTAEPTAYEKFVASTDNFYDAIDIAQLEKKSSARYKSVEEYSDAFERYYASGGATKYYQTVQREICKVFVQFPPYYPLIKKYNNSYFVRIDFPSSEKYFVLGVLQSQGKVRYICYGLPAEQDGFFDKDFTYVQDTPTSFWMLFQDADSGQITTLNQKV